MLVLSRKNAQTVVIGGSDFETVIKVTVLDIRRGSVRLGFEGGKDVAVHREEVWERIGTGSPGAPSIGGPERTGSRTANGKATVLSGKGKGVSRSRSLNAGHRTCGVLTENRGEPCQTAADDNDEDEP